MISDFNNKILIQVLPKIIWVGFSRNLSQPIHLIEKDSLLTYDFESNITPKTTPSGAKHLKSYYSAKSWVAKLNQKCLLFNKRWVYINKMSEIVKSVKDIFPYYDFLIDPSDELPKISNQEREDKDEFQCIDLLLVRDSTHIKKCKERFNRFFRINGIIKCNENIFDYNIEYIDDILKMFNNSYDEYLDKLEKNYIRRLDEYSIFGSLGLSSRTKIPYIFCFRYIHEQHNRNKMRERWVASSNN